MWFCKSCFRTRRSVVWQLIGIRESVCRCMLGFMADSSSRVVRHLLVEVIRRGALLLECWSKEIEETRRFGGGSSPCVSSTSVGHCSVHTASCESHAPQVWPYFQSRVTSNSGLHIDAKGRGRVQRVKQDSERTLCATELALGLRLDVRRMVWDEAPCMSRPLEMITCA